jgi:small subunit ribosomal protein S11
LAKSGKRRTKRNVAKGIAHIKATFNNTLITITDVNGDAMCWASAGSVSLGGGEKKFSGARKSTPFAAQRAAQYCANEAKKHGVVESMCASRARAPGASRRSPHCRPPVCGFRRLRMSLRCRTTAAVLARSGGSRSHGTFGRPNNASVAP